MADKVDCSRQNGIIVKATNIMGFLYQLFGTFKNENKTTSLFDEVIFNDCIFQQIQDFPGYSVTNNVLNLSKKFIIMKKSKYYWKLNREYSVNYCSDADFKLKLNSLLDLAEKPLLLDLGKNMAILILLMSVHLARLIS
jgi:hypothetical protein